MARFALSHIVRRRTVWFGTMGEFRLHLTAENSRHRCQQENTPVSAFVANPELHLARLVLLEVLSPGATA